MYTTKYNMKYMFDWGSGTCLWSVNESALNKYGYDVDVKELPVSEELKKRMLDLISKHDEALNWEEPNIGLIWTEKQQTKFIIEAKKVYKDICSELGLDYGVEMIEEFLI